MQKTVYVVGHTESTGNYITHQLLTFLADYINVCTWCTSQSPTPPADLHSADIYIVSNRTVWSAIRNFFPTGKPVLIADRVIGTEYIDKLLDLEPGTRTFVVGTTQETVQNTITILHNLGFLHFEFIPYYPGIRGEQDETIDVAITTGLSYLAPRNVKTIIDLGGKGLNLSSFAELLRHLNVPFTILNDISHYYLQTVVHNARRIRSIGRQSELIKKRLEVILDTVDEAIVSVDADENIVLFNQAADKLLRTDKPVIGEKIDDIVPEMRLSDVLRSGEGIHREIRAINDHHFFLTANLIISQTDAVEGIVASLKPVQEIQELDTQIRQELKKKGNWAKYTFDDIKGKSPELMKAVSMSLRFAQTELTILLEAESGTGKELFAQSIHNASPRRNGPFVAINFAAIPDSLIESELFGYEDGAFTGARKGGRPGLFEEAHTGTIFLDEIGSASSEVQNRLLRVLEEKEVRRLGSARVTPVDVRVVAATNISLESLVGEKRFREDLFYRLCILPIVIPPLRARKSDIMVLIKYFAARNSRKSIRIGSLLEDFLVHYQWPGNIRELQNVVKYLCSVSESNRPVDLADLPPYLAAKIESQVQARSGSDKLRLSIPQELTDPETSRLVNKLLTEVSKYSITSSGVGWNKLLKQLDGEARVSEHVIKRWLQNLGKWGYVETGRTRQGTRLTPRGEELLRFLNA